MSSVLRLARALRLTYSRWLEESARTAFAACAVAGQHLGRSPPPDLALATHPAVLPPSAGEAERDFGIVWNTPKKRKSLEMRHREGHGVLEWGTTRMYKLNRRLRFDHVSGRPYELGKMELGHYQAAMEETKAIQEKMREAFGLGPKDKELKVAYAGEEDGDQFGKNVQVVRMEKERPTFFSKALLQKSTKTGPDDTTTTVRPSGLG